MKNPYKYVLIATLLIGLNHVHAQSEESSPAQSTGEQAITGQQTAVGDATSDKKNNDSDIRVRQAGTTTVKEFHQQGKVYKVEIAPKNTPAYILSDQDGNGNLNSSDTRIDNDLVIPEWTIGNW